MLNQLHQAIQSGEIWAVGGRRYGNIEDLLIPQEEWKQIREQCYEELQLPMDPQQWIDASLSKLISQIQTTTNNLATNEHAFVENDRVHLKSIDPAELPERVVKLKERVDSSWPQEITKSTEIF